MFGQRDLHAQMKKVLLLQFYRFVLHWGMNLECIPEYRVHLTLRGRNSFYMHPRGIKGISNASFFHAHDNKNIKLAEYKLTRSELFVEHSKKTPSLKSASFSKRRFAGYAYSFEVAWRSNLGDHSRDRTRACKTREFHCHPLEPGKYATEIRGPQLLQINFSHTYNFGKLNWPRKVDRNGGCDSCERPLVVLVKALIGQSLQPLEPNSRSVTFWRYSKTPHGVNKRRTSPGSWSQGFPAIPKSMRSVNGDQSSDFPDRFWNEKWNARAHSVRVHLQHFQSHWGYRAHALSSVVKSSLRQLDMQAQSWVLFFF